MRLQAGRVTLAVQLTYQPTNSPAIQLTNPPICPARHARVTFAGFPPGPGPHAEPPDPARRAVLRPLQPTRGPSQDGGESPESTLRRSAPDGGAGEADQGRRASGGRPDPLDQHPDRQEL